MTVTGAEPTADHAPAPTGIRPGRLASDRSASVVPDLFDLVVPWVVGLVTFVARVATGAVGPTDWDSAQYAAGVARFDVTHGRPQPPGYFLYVVAGRLVHAFGVGTIHSLVLVSAVASGLAAGLVVVAGRDLGGRWVGLCAGLLVATSPFAWFSGSVVATYSFDLAVAPLLIILAWRARPHSWHGAAALATLGLAAGFRQSIVQSFAVLALLAVAGSVRRVREAVVAGAAGAVAVALWLIPLALSQPGGLTAWARATRLETRGAFQATSVLDHAQGGAVNLGTFAGYTVVALGPTLLVALVSGLVLGVRALVRLVRRGVHERTDLDTTRLDPVGSDMVESDTVDSDTVESDTVDSETVESDTVESDTVDSDAVDSDAVDSNAVATGAPDGRPVDPVWGRPWYQSKVAILAAAIIPPVALVALVEFAKGGYLLAYLPGAVIALLLVPAAVLRTGSPARTRGLPTTTAGNSDTTTPSPTPTNTNTDSDTDTDTGPMERDRPGVPGRTVVQGIWLVLVSLAVLAIAVVGVDRFLSGTGVLPAAANASPTGLWITQARYQAPYPDTRATIRQMDTIDAELAALAPHVDARRDVVVIDTPDGGATFYRNAGWALPGHRVTLITPGAAIYNQLHGSLYYLQSTTVPVGPGGYVYLIASPALPGLAALAGEGRVAPVATHRIADYLVWRITPGSTLLGVRIVEQAGPRPLGSGLGT